MPSPFLIRQRKRFKITDKFSVLFVERMVNDIVRLLGQAQNIVAAHTENFRQLYKRLHTGIMLAVFISADGFLTDA